MPYKPQHPLIGLLGWLFLTFIVVALAAFASADAGAFYRQLVQPPWAPPAWVFGPAWTTLYLLMAVAAWLVWRRHGLRAAGPALGLYMIQLLANALWTWLFFVWRLGGLAFVEILLLWCLIVATIIAFLRLHRLAAVLLLPYLAWVSFAAALSYHIWKLNPGMLA